MDKKRIIIFSILAPLAIFIVVASLFLPVVHLVAKDSSEVIVYDKTISLINYFQDAPFLSTAADEIYFNSSGPVWMATGSLMLLMLPALLGLIMFVLCIFEICLCKTNNVSIKNNVLAKKFSIFAGSTTLVCSLFAIISFVITTMMANGYMAFGLACGPFILVGAGLLVVVLAIISCKREKEQQASKIKNSIGFGLTAIFSLVCAIVPFLPFYSEYFWSADATSMWQVARLSGDLSGEPSIIKMMGDYPFGFAQWAILALLLVCAFVFVYALIGFIRALSGKTTNWLSSRVKRWSMALAIVFEVLLFLILCQLGVITSTLTYFDGVESVFMLTGFSIVLAMLPFIPYIISTIISVSKNKKQKEIKSTQKGTENDLATS